LIGELRQILEADEWHASGLHALLRHPMRQAAQFSVMQDHHPTQHFFQQLGNLSVYDLKSLKDVVLQL